MPIIYRPIKTNFGIGRYLYRQIQNKALSVVPYLQERRTKPLPLQLLRVLPREAAAAAGAGGGRGGAARPGGDGGVPAEDGEGRAGDAGQALRRHGRGRDAGLRPCFMGVRGTGACRMTDRQAVAVLKLK